MVKIYTTPSCASCRKAKKWFDEHNITYQEKNIFNQPLTKEDIKSMLQNSENGFDDIISMRSKVIKDNNLDIQDMKFSELEKLILENPSILKRPIIIDNRKFQVGYNDEEIRVFIPRELRKLIMCGSCTKDCEYTKALEAMEIK
ncbi:MAG: Spx/MgsR family RNA polymerase-binding regulatory protein [bacterium]